VSGVLVVVGGRPLRKTNLRCDENSSTLSYILDQTRLKRDVDVEMIAAH
jgi:hypothetical protein